MSPLTSTTQRLVSAAVMRTLLTGTPPAPVYGKVFAGVNPATPQIVNINVYGPVGVYNQFWLVPVGEAFPDRYRLRTHKTDGYDVDRCIVNNDLGDLITTNGDTQDTGWSCGTGGYLTPGTDHPVCIFDNGFWFMLAPLDGLGPL